MHSTSNQQSLIDGQASFNQLVAAHPFVVVTFTAQWCEPCKKFAQVLDIMAELYPNIVFAIADVDVATDLAEHFQVKQVPALMAIRDRIVIDLVTGYMQAHELEHHLHMWNALDLSEIEAHFAQQTPADSSPSPL